MLLRKASRRYSASTAALAVIAGTGLELVDVVVFSVFSAVMLISETAPGDTVVEVAQQVTKYAMKVTSERCSRTIVSVV